MAEKNMPYYEFYSKARWDNWISQIKEAGFSLEDEEKAEKSAMIFVNMADDVILSCLKVAARFEKGAIDAEGALEILGTIQDIVLEEVPPISEDADIMIMSVQDSLNCSMAAFEAYFLEDYDKKADIKKLIKEAGAAEEGEDMDAAFIIVANIGAMVIGGEPFEEEYLTILPEESIVAEWLDGIDSIAAAMIGTDSYKNFDEVDDED
ncbi:DUF2150 family protein [Methanimicrococcus blatticola]|uniref:DUF2150 family protein n=1 Tax=Methanimicrococcus blatticola TaxID=91560 RepID=A0A484F6C1_9EURY|nr:DUF2150 family protein [Methanimicrococcus blatticola]MBZ3935152.1 DUF2150 family protein [Methanimicrococcus blatticola]MCC2508751.1 DUF2150 family protein [Methanimicrococcus blatticola]TDQ71214.1 hypothetical protein C7391_0319 [Methanimicrococcus blatticola]